MKSIVDIVPITKQFDEEENFKRVEKLSSLNTYNLDLNSNSRWEGSFQQIN